MSKPFYDDSEAGKSDIHRDDGKEGEKPTNVKSEKLPSRYELNQSKRKLQHPLLKILLVLFFITPIIVFSVYSHIQNKNYSQANEDTSLVVNDKQNNQQNVEQEDDEIINDDPKEEKDENLDLDNRVETESKVKDKQEEQKDINMQHNEQSTTKVEKANNNVKKEQLKTEKQVEQPKQAEKPKQIEKSKQPKQVEKLQTEPKHPEKKDTPKMASHTVKPGETLFSISMQYFNSQEGIVKIRQQNGIRENEIEVGQVLQIPLPQ